jgi:hypothetical protein
MNSVKFLLILFVSMTIFGCANPSIVSVKSEKLGAHDGATLFIPRFEGNPDFVEESTDYFVSVLEANNDNSIIQGSVLRQESTDITSGGNLAPMELALKSAKAQGADLLVLGKVTSYSSISTLNGFSTIKVIDVETGEKLANFHRPSGILIGYSEHQAVMAAVKRTAEDLAAALK